MSISPDKPVVMCFSGLDTTGGAGIQADIETLFSIGCHCAPVVTALTVQDTHNVISFNATDPSMLIQQSRAVLEDLPVQCFKIGLLGSIKSVEVIYTLLKDFSLIPVVLDPVFMAGGGFEFGGDELKDVIKNLLLPLTTVLTPNTDEIMRLAPSSDNLDACANEILELGCQNVLLTGTHSRTVEVINRFYSTHQETAVFNWPRLEQSYHGSGCTLAAAIAGNLAHQLSIREAIQNAQHFTWESLKHGYRIGFGQHVPNRSYWNQQKL